MAFDQQTRNRLAHFVADTRDALSNEFTRQLQHEYGMDPETGEVSDLSTLGHLDDSRRETARLLRETMEHYVATSPSGGNKEALARIVREQAFTILNRLCAIRMAEARVLVIESICRGYQSKGFQLYARLAGTALGERGDIYKQYLLSLFDEFAIDLPVLFDRFSPHGRLFPRENVLLKVLEEINSADLETLWAEDETIGWIYQYFNSIEERRQMRADSSAPRDSRELAVRNQFFTPRYVVEFLTDNTLGRIWYEMRKGETALKDECRYLVRRPNEVFLKVGDNPPEDKGDDTDLSQEELLKKTVYIEHRPKKDPRDLKILDPACGSGHFLLYSFDLLERMYREAWEDAESPKSELTGNSLIQDFDSTDDLIRAIPKLIVEHNLYGIEIDPRCAQIAGLCLWLRAQKSWNNQGLKASDRSQIEKSGIVVAEPMPGEEHLKKEFLNGLRPKVLGQLVEVVFDKMKLAGEAGSLLKIEEEISSVVAKAKEQWKKAPKAEQEELFAFPKKQEAVQQQLFDLSGVTDEQFWEDAEERILHALLAYSKLVENGKSTSRRLFANDIARGFAFIDVCRIRYDTVLMNPPFGAAIPSTLELLETSYENAKSDLYACFVYRATRLLLSGGLVGVISARTGFFLHSLRGWRQDLLSGEYSPTLFADLGGGVLDSAMVETATYVISRSCVDEVVFINASADKGKDQAINTALIKLRSGEWPDNLYIKPTLLFRKLPEEVWAYWVSEKVVESFDRYPSIEPEIAKVCVGVQTDDDYRFVRLWWEIPQAAIGNSINDSASEKEWFAFIKGGDARGFYSDISAVLNWKKDGRELKEAITIVLKGGHWSRHVFNSEVYFREGLSWALRTSYFSPHIIPRGCIPSVSRYLALAENISPFLLLSYLNTPVYDYIVKLNMEKWLQPKFIVSSVKRLPIPQALSENIDEEIIGKTSVLVRKLLELGQLNETSRYGAPGQIDHSNNLDSALSKIAENHREVSELQSEVRKLATARVLEGFDLVERDLLQPSVADLEQMDHSGSDQKDGTENKKEFTAAHLSFIIGCLFGRWDVRMALDQSLTARIQDSLEPMPICAPGMLVGVTALPAQATNIVSEEWLRAKPDANALPPNGVVQSPIIAETEYPISVSWNGILVDDRGHRDDIESSIRQVLRVIWTENSDAVEREACDALGVKSLRTYFAKSSSFFDFHLRRYSKCRRKAPIYWPLSTTSTSYTLWLYYHRLTSQTLFTCVNDYVEPKLKQISQEVLRLRGKSSRSSAEEKELTHLSDLQRELEDFRDELLRLSRFWKPNLNDGVQITAAPLWKLFQHRQWQNKLKDTWKKLEKGDYDWAHLAYSIWPDRVKEKCKMDKSLAIAHGLEELYVESRTNTKKSKTKK